MFTGLKQKEVLVWCLHLKCRVDLIGYLLFSETENPYLLPQYLWQEIVPVSSISAKNNAFFFSSR